MTTFHTSDAIQDVKAFYPTAMLRDGWQASHANGDNLAFMYNDCPFYSVDVMVHEEKGKQTNVEVQLSKEFCR